MFRFLPRKFNRVRTVLLLGGLLMVFYLYKDYLDYEILHVDAGMDGSRILPLIQNTSYVFSWPSCEKNMSVDNITNFHILPDRMQDYFYYQHCRHFPMLLDLPDKCGGADGSSEVFLLLVIKSSPENYDRRETLRKTWANESLQNSVWVRRIFIIGSMGLDIEKKRVNKVLKLEQSQHNDILQWDFKDTFYNLTLKQILFLEWMERNCPKARFLLNGDDDVFVNINNVVKYLQSLEDNDGSKHLFTGCLVRGMPPIRDSWSKYFVPVQLYKLDSYLPYCSGGGFLLSGYTALVIYNMSKSIALLPIDDAYMGLCLAKAGLSPDMHLGVKPLGLHGLSRRADEYDPCFYKELLLVHRFLSAQTYLMWHSINDPNLKCFGNAK
ncbi:acetylgalactosaminyl-O-glycosyl-glycoprotein beta-1,3-N-acetylglucosaminyltransferase-like [Labrus mixtus]|uniref:acetylgalactosaminyl-O-glycosyl-glycoprotein beta-1,3-N-acetylglucosaminyltransferase-like n=1 Tax=Labrus mixtus TaxID=508554 RepID=UPI0029BFA9E8|nr:acetylgalactosaminyl-O-glycosyl-glycoprotein beta-1,3-N-acetylglucosaminyltransferase-like [Labrus mixtus]